MDNKIIDQITAHAARAFPHECCGLILNVGGSIFILECENQSHEPEKSFLIDPMTFALHAAAVVAIYHSHPNRAPTPSQADIASAERCNVPFLILSYPGSEIYTYTPQGIGPQPYEGRAFVYGVMDCLSLVSDYYQQEFGIYLNDGERKRWEWWLDPENAHAFIDGFKNAGFFEIDRPEAGDVVIMQIQSPCPNHAAIYLGDSVILHHPGEKNMSRAEMYGHYWRHNTVCYLRHQDRVTHENY